jgi:hypothetical protein
VCQLHPVSAPRGVLLLERIEVSRKNCYLDICESFSCPISYCWRCGCLRLFIHPLASCIA